MATPLLSIRSTPSFPYSSLFFTHQTNSAKPDSPIWVSLNNRDHFRCKSSKKPGFFDQILDYIEGGPKLRKWYGAPELLPKDGLAAGDEDDTEVEEDRNAVLVSDGDSEIGQMVILTLIVKRMRVKALVKDKRAAMEAFGNYVESIAGDTNDIAFLKKSLRSVRTIICTNEGFLSNVDSLRGVEHIVYLSQLSAYRAANGIQALMTSNARKLAEQDEAILLASGIPYTLIRAGALNNSPGGSQGFNFEEGAAAKGTLSKEDAAFICAEALAFVPPTGLLFEVINGENKVSDWKQCFMYLIEKAGKK
ncbi:hypothetical protein Drorol1_Dr00013428 [Drosera rotundifolia]